MNNIITPCANKMLVQTYHALHKLKYKFLNSNKTSCEFFLRKDPLYDQVDRAMCYYVQNAAARQKALEKEKAKPRQPRLKKIKIHKKASLLRDAMEANSKAQTVSLPAEKTTPKTKSMDVNAKAKMSESNASKGLNVTCSEKSTNKPLTTFATLERPESSSKPLFPIFPQNSSLQKKTDKRLNPSAESEQANKKQCVLPFF